MPKSKRNRIVSLTSTRKKGFELKSGLINEIRSNVDNYARIFVFSVQNMRNSKLKDVRQEWKHSRFFFGKNKVMTHSLGKCAEDEYKENLHKISSRLYGQCGLMFTNSTKDEVLKWFNSYSDTDYARSGNTATETITLDAGPLKQFPHSLEPHLRQLGMPTTLEKGVVTLVKDFHVCKEGETLTSEQTRILKLLGNQMAQFKISIDAIWSNDGTYEELVPQKKPTSNDDISDLSEDDNSAKQIPQKSRNKNSRKKKFNKKIKNKKSESEDEVMSSDESD